MRSFKKKKVEEKEEKTSTECKRHYLVKFKVLIGSEWLVILEELVEWVGSYSVPHSVSESSVKLDNVDVLSVFINAHLKGKKYVFDGISFNTSRLEGKMVEVRGV